MVDTPAPDDPWAKYRVAAPVDAAPVADDPWAKYRGSTVVQPGEQQTDPYTGVQLPGAASQPTTNADVAALKQGLYGNDARGAGLAATSHFVSDIPVVGPPLAAATDRAAAGLQSITGGGSPSENLAKVQKSEAEADKAHPLAAEVGGDAGNIAALTVAAPLAPELFGLDRGAMLARNTYNAARTGGLLSGTTTAEKDITDPAKTWGDMAKDVGISTGIGAATFGAGPAVGETIGALASSLAQKSAAAGSPLAAEDQRALGWAIENLKRDNLMTDAQIDQAYAEKGPKAFLFEYGPNSFGSANAIGATQSAAKTQIFEGLKARAAQVPQEIEDGITNVLGPRQNLAAVTRSDIAARKGAADPLYAQFRDTTVFPTQGVKDLIAGTGEGAGRVPGLEELGLLRDANTVAQREAVATGQPSPPMQNFFTTGERKSWPTTASFDYIKQAIDDRIAASYVMRPGEMTPQPTNATRQYVMMKNRLDDAVATSNPEAANVWKQAREAWGNPSEIMNARAEGQQIFDRGTRRDELQLKLDDPRTTAPIKKALLEGVRDSFAEDMDASVRGATGAQNKLLSPAGQDKARMLSKAVTGDEAPAQALIDRLDQMKNETASKNAITGNSAMAARQMALQQMTPDPSQTLTARVRSAYSPHVSPGSYLPKALEDAAARGQQQQFENSMNAMAPWLMKQGPEALAFAKALAAHGAAQQGAQQGGRPVGQMVQLLAQGLTPRTTPFIQNQFQPNQP